MPRPTCICGFVTPTPTACEVLILQHPLETLEAKNSARLLHLSPALQRLRGTGAGGGRRRTLAAATDRV